MTLYERPSDATPEITAGALLDDPGLELKVVLVAGRPGLSRTIKHPRIQKSGLALVGHVHGLVPARVQVLGETELSYVQTLGFAEQHAAAGHFFSLRPACVMVTRGVSVPAPLAAAAEKTETPLVVCQERTSQAITALHTLLDQRLAPRTRLHGVLVDVFEVGVLLIGKSGIGKSEAALDLVLRGHRLVADDAVECDYRPPGMIFGEPAALLRYHIEVRGLGILDVKELYGVTAIRERKRIDLIVRLEETLEPSDRIGLEHTVHRILGVPIREVMLPVRPGRNMSSIIEIAARHELLKRSGRDSARELVERVDRTLTRPDESGTLHAVRPPESSVAGARLVESDAARQFESSVPPPVGTKGDP
jgi:HPr kinase/phosphorylase